MKLWGHALQQSSLSPHDSQILWSVSLVAFWSASRMGELLSHDQSSIDYIRTITWGKVNIISESQITILIAIPKTTESHSKAGHVIDLFAFSDKRYCPLFNLDKLHDFSLTKNRGDNDDCAFLWESGHMLTMGNMNYYLDFLLAPYLKDVKCNYSCHSFRAGLPSLMANNPSIFSEEDIMQVGRWSSPAVKRYLRVKGVANSRIMNKIHSVLRK